MSWHKRIVNGQVLPFMEEGLTNRAASTTKPDHLHHAASDKYVYFSSTDNADIERV